MQDPKSVTNLRQGDIGTLKRLFKSNHAGLYPLAFRLTRDAGTADEIIRASFEGLWADRAKLDPLEVIFNRLLSYVFERASAYRSANNITGIESGARTTAGEEIEEKLGKLPEEQRLMYLLRVVDGYSVRELSRAFGSPEKQVEELVGTAMVALDNQFEEDLRKSTGSPASSDLWQ